MENNTLSTPTPYYRRRESNRGSARSCAIRRMAVVLLFIIVFSAIAIAIDNGMREPLRELATEKVRAIASEALNMAVLNVLDTCENSSTLLSIEDRGEDTYLIIADTTQISRIAAQMTAEAQSLIAELGAEGIGIPFGTVSGIALFTGLGPDINVEFSPMGSVNSKYNSSLRSSGINQCLFSIKLTLSASVRLILGGSEDTVAVSTTTAICETVIVGDVPQVYTNVANEEDMLNLIPTDIP